MDEKTTCKAEGFSLQREGQELMKLESWQGLAPWAVFAAPTGAYARWGFPRTEVEGRMAFPGGVEVYAEGGVLKVRSAGALWRLGPEGWERE